MSASNSSREPSPTFSGVVLWLTRRFLGLVLLSLCGPIAWAIWGILHQTGTQDHFWLRMAGNGSIFIGGWLLFGPQVARDKSREDQ